jgi:tetratricopeptide (TPR) repeat protein
MHFGVGRQEFLNVASAGELASGSALDCALCSPLSGNKGRNQTQVWKVHRTIGSGARNLNTMFVRVRIVIALIFSVITGSTASPAFAASGAFVASGHSPVTQRSVVRTNPAGASGPACRSVKSTVRPGDEVGPAACDTGAGVVTHQDLSRVRTLPPVASRKLTTAQRVAQLEAVTRANPQAGEQWRELGAAYVRQAFETADPAFYPLAESSLRRAEQNLGATPEVMVAKAGLALARHRFADARELAGNVVRDRPEAIAGKIALFDAEVELGNYERAFSSIDALVAQRPNVATLSRLSYRRQLSGDLLGAEIAMRQAVSAAPPDSIDRAVALGYLGDVLLEGGRLDAASRSYEQSARLDPTNGTAAIGQARVLLAQGDHQAAVALLDRLVDRNPLPGALGLRAEIARSLNDTKLTKASDELVDASLALFQFNGAVVDAELAILLADRGPVSAEAAIVAARRAYAERRTVFTNDAMAWSLFVAGRSSEAVRFARAAVAMSPGISSVRWHAGEVFAATGDVASARVEVVAAMRNPWSTPAQSKALRSLAARVGVPSSANSLSTRTRAATGTKAPRLHIPTSRPIEVSNV